MKTFIYLSLLILAFVIIILDLRFFIISSNSMYPTYSKGTLVITKQKASYYNGAVITYESISNVLVTHRIVGLSRENKGIAYTTKGDSNKHIDSQKITPESIVGEVIFDIRFGFLLSTLVFYVFICLPFGFIFGVLAYKIVVLSLYVAA